MLQSHERLSIKMCFFFFYFNGFIIKRVSISLSNCIIIVVLYMLIFVELHCQVFFPFLFSLICLYIKICTLECVFTSRSDPVFSPLCSRPSQQRQTSIEGIDWGIFPSLPFAPAFSFLHIGASSRCLCLTGYFVGP